MADLTITTTQVLPDTSGVRTMETAGEALTQGQAVYIKAADGFAWTSQCDGTAAEAAAVGIVLTGAGAANQPVVIQRTGTVVLGAGAAPTEGEVYCVSDTAGNIAPDADIATATWYRTILGTGDGTNGIVLAISASGQQIP